MTACATNRLPVYATYPPQKCLLGLPQMPVVLEEEREEELEEEEEGRGEEGGGRLGQGEQGE